MSSHQNVPVDVRTEVQQDCDGKDVQIHLPPRAFDLFHRELVERTLADRRAGLGVVLAQRRLPSGRREGLFWIGLHSCGDVGDSTVGGTLGKGRKSQGK